MDAIGTTEARLGTPEQLASLAGTEFRRRTFAGRHPVFTFVVGPVIAIVATLVAVCLVSFGLSWAMCWAIDVDPSANRTFDFPTSPLEIGIVGVFNALVRFVPFAISAWLFMRLGERAGLRAWSISACCIVALVAIGFTSVVTPASPGEPGRWMIGVGLNLGLDQVLQAVVPLVVAGWFIGRHVRLHGPEIAV